MRRIQSFEFHELPATPRFIGDSIPEILGAYWRFGKRFNLLGSVFAEFCRRSNCSKVLDLGSGSGEPVSLLVDGLQKEGVSHVRFMLSDLFPNVRNMEKVAARYPGQVEVMHDPVDATNVPEEVDCDACTIIGVFHHFPPELARRILADCVKKGRAVFVLDAPRKVRPRFIFWLLLLFPIFAAIPLLTVLTNSLLSDEDRFLKGFFTYFIPVIPFVANWDAIVSFLRMYNKDELMGLVEGLSSDYEWEHKEIELPFGALMSAFLGMPKK